MWKIVQKCLVLRDNVPAFKFHITMQTIHGLGFELLEQSPLFIYQI